MTLNKKIPLAILVTAGLSLFLIGCGKGSEKKVSFGNLEDGSNVESPFKVQMKAENLIVEPATVLMRELRYRNIELAITRLVDAQIEEDLKTQILFHDELAVICGKAQQVGAPPPSKTQSIVG